MVWSPPFTSLLIPCHFPLCVSQRRQMTTSSSRTWGFSLSCVYAVPLPLSGFCLLLPLSTGGPWSLFKSLLWFHPLRRLSQTMGPFPSGQTRPLPFHSLQAWNAFLQLPINSGFVVLSPAGIYSTPRGRKISIPSTGLTLRLTWHLIKLAAYKWCFYSFTFCAISQTNKNSNKTNIACYPTELTPNFFLLTEIIPSWLQVIFSLILDHSPTNFRSNFTFTIGASLNKIPRHVPCLKPSLCGKRLILLCKILPPFQKSAVIST